MAEAAVGWYNEWQTRSLTSKELVHLPPFEFISTRAQWRDCLACINKEKRLAVDLEANSLYAYRERVCLIQISTEKRDYIVDPEQKLDLSGFGTVIQDPSVEKVFHAAEYDLMLLKRQYGWELQNLFDTMWAARILGVDRYGLASLLKDRHGIKLNKKYQKANWCRRPLPQAQLTYAQMDTHFLLNLRRELWTELKKAGRLEEAEEIFAEQTDVTPADNAFDPDDFWHISGAYDLNGRQQAILKALAIFRDQQARQQDRPPFKIFEDKTALELAERAPESLEELRPIYGMSRGQIRRYGRRLLKVIHQAKDDPLPKRPRNTNHRPPDRVAARYDRLHNWRKRRARKRGVESDVIISRQAMWELAKRYPRSVEQMANMDILGPWRCKTYGNELIQELRG